MGRLTKVLVLGAALGFGGVLALWLAPWQDLEKDFGLPWLYATRGPVQPPAEVLIVAIDENAAQRLGVSDKPRDWPRSLHAELVRFLHGAGARVIVFDLTFDTPAPQPEEDTQFVAAIAAAGNVLVTESVRRELVAIDASGDSPAATLVVDRPVPPIAAIVAAASGHAPFLLPKASRVDAYWTSRAGNPDLPTLPVLALRRFALDTAAPGERARIDRTLAAVQTQGDTAYLNLYGPPHTIAQRPYAEVIALARGQFADADRAAEQAEAFRGKAVFVGLSARTPAGQDRLRDDYETVFSQPSGLNLTGVELAATAFANLLDGRPLQPLRSGPQIGVVLGWGLLLAVVNLCLPPARALALGVVLALLYAGFAVERFGTAALWLPSVVPLAVQLPLAMLAGAVFHYRNIQRERGAIKRAFGHFLPGAMVDQLAQDLGTLTHANRVVHGSCLATDAGNYTALAERLDPGELGRLMNDYFAQLFVPVERSGGAVIDVVGDAIVAIWASPGLRSDAGLRRNACRAALEIVVAANRFDGALGPPLSLPTRLGLHAGEMLVGNIGASRHYEYRAVGDIVNTASRLQGLNKLLGTQLLASTAAVAGVDGLATRALGSFVLSGKTSPLSVVELLGLQADADPARQRLCRRFELALGSYAAAQWQVAADRFAAILDHHPGDGPSRFYLARCRALLADPPAGDWSATVTVASK